MPFGYLEFSRAIGRKPYPHMRTRAPPLAPGLGPGSGSGSGLGEGAGSLPGLVLFKLGLTSMGYAEHTRSAIRIRTAPCNGCQPTAPGSWVGAAVETNRCNSSDRTDATVWLGSDQNTPPEAL